MEHIRDLLIPTGGLVVSCQALPGEPLHGTSHMAAMALAAKTAGAAAIRAGLSDIPEIKRATGLPVIGLVKRQYPGFEIYITPTVQDAVRVGAAGADIVAIDATARPRPDGLDLRQTIERLKAEGLRVMADISTCEEGLRAAAWGADCISTTLCGYTRETENVPLPALDLLERLARELGVPVVAEGGVQHPEQAAEALRRGAAFVVVGSAITRPQWITEQYIRAISAAAEDHAGQMP